MSEYDTIKNGIVTRLAGLGFSESKHAFDFENASSREYDKKFILLALSGIMDEENSETIVDRFYDMQTWQIQIAFDKSSFNDVIQRDNMQRKKDEILKDIDDPTNWESFARILKYRSWEIEEGSEYFLLNIVLEVQVKYSY